MIAVRRLAAAAPLLGALLVPLVLLRAGPARGDTAPEDLYLRDVRTVERAVEILGGEVKRLRAPVVLVAFDHVTFAPPPGRNEYRYDHDYAGDLDGWLDALERWAADVETPIHACSTRATRPVEVGASGWRARLGADLDPAWWRTGSPRCERALTWARRLAPKGSRERRALLVLIASEMTPERWSDDGAAWRRALLPIGDYWDEEAIAALLSKRRSALAVVAPEVRFGDELPFAALSEPPWASRPQRPPPEYYGSYGPDPDEAWDRMLREDLERDLADEFPDPVERKREIDRILARPEEEEPPTDGAGRESPTAPAGPTEPDEEPAVAARAGGRYTSGTPSLFPRWGGTRLFANDVPSAFGYWPFARVAAKSGGRYVCYPYGPSAFLDTCPRDDRALRRLAPPLGTRAALERRLRGGPAYGALRRAEALVRGVTPWADDGDGRASSRWNGRPRRRPCDLRPSGRAAALESVGRSLEAALPRYDEALALLDATLARAGARAHPRALADLRLGRFWFALSAFHLQALALCLLEIERYVPEHFDPGSDDFFTSMLPVIKLSDCLDAYDGRTITALEEGHYPRTLHRAWTPPGRDPEDGWWEPGQIVPGQQGNILAIPLGAPDYRARRDLDAVLEHVDPRLRTRAIRMIEAAREVMAHHARTPWGWTVYYTEAQCYFFDPVDLGLDVRPAPGEASPEVPSSPTGPGGSTPGGPSSGR